MDSFPKKKIIKVAKKYNLDLLLLFGSQVSGKKLFPKESDFDVAYLTKRVLDIEKKIELNCDLMDIFYSDKIDLVDLKRVDPFLRYEIAKNSKLLFGAEIDYLEFKAFAFRDYIDHQNIFDLQEVLIKKRHQLLKQSIYGK